MDASLGKIPTTSARRLTSLLTRSIGLVEVDLGSVLDGKVHVGEDVGLALVDEGREFRPFGAELVGGVPQRLAGGRAIGLHERLAQGGRHHALLGAADVGLGVAHPMHAAPLPRRTHDPADRGLEALVGIGPDDEVVAGT